MKSFLFVLLIVLTATTQAQVLMNLQLPPAGIVLKNQLWNFSLVNSSNSIVNVQVQVVLTDVATNRRILTGTSKMIQLSKGIKQIQAGDVMPVVYNNTGTGIANADGFLPVGKFTVCFTIVRYNNDITEQMTEECTTIDVEPVSPPLLIMPADSAKVEEVRPLFTWLPPAPYTLFNNLLYDWVLVEVQPLQTAAEAVQKNLPLFTQRNIAYTSLQYPFSMPALDTGKLYAWRVIAQSNLLPVATSETWSFRVQLPGDGVKTSTSTLYYVKLQPQEDAAHALCTGVLNYEYMNELNDTTVLVKLFDITHSRRKEISLNSDSYAVRFGQNFMQLDLRQNRNMVNKNTYLFELTNARSEKWYVKFEFRE